MKRKKVILNLAMAAIMMAGSLSTVAARAVEFYGSSTGNFVGGNGSLSLYSNGANATTSVGNAYTAYVKVKCQFQSTFTSTVIWRDYVQNSATTYTSSSNAAPVGHVALQAISKHWGSQEGAAQTLTLTNRK